MRFLIILYILIELVKQHRFPLMLVAATLCAYMMHATEGKNIVWALGWGFSCSYILAHWSKQ